MQRLHLQVHVSLQHKQLHLQCHGLQGTDVMPVVVQPVTAYVYRIVYLILDLISHMAKVHLVPILCSPASFHKLS